MRSTLLPVFLLQGAALAPVALAVQLYNADVPAGCVPICAPIVQLTDLCTVAPAAPVPVASSIRTITTATTRATGASSARATEDNHGGSKGTSSGAAASAHNSAEDNTARTGAAATATSHAGEDNLARIGDDSNHGSTSHGSTTTAVASATAAVSENIPAPTGGDSSGQPSGNHGGEAESHGGSSGENHSGKRRLRRQNSITAQCFCSNRSFDVRAVAGLCASCLRQNGVRAGNAMDQLMGSCSFPSTTFFPTATAILAQITVNAGTGGTATRSGTGSSTSGGTIQTATTNAASRAEIPRAIALGLALLRLL